MFFLPHLIKLSTQALPQATCSRGLSSLAVTGSLPGPRATGHFLRFQSATCSPTCKAPAQRRHGTWKAPSDDTTRQTFPRMARSGCDRQLLQARVNCSGTQLGDFEWLGGLEGDGIMFLTR